MLRLLVAALVAVTFLASHPPSLMEAVWAIYVVSMTWMALRPPSGAHEAAIPPHTP